MKISFIGFGHMAKAIAQPLLQQESYDIYAASPSLSVGKTAEGIFTHHENQAIIVDSDLIVLGVKPDKALSVLQQIGPHLPENSLLISIVAGRNLDSLAVNCHPHQAIVRSMPNMPISIGQGATVLMANAYVNPTQKIAVEQLFQSAGITAWMEQESDIDRMTAISGSGPAYVFYFMEAIMHAGKKLGLSDELLQPFVLQTVSGALDLAKQSDLSLEALRRTITSPGGTTEAATKVFQAQGFDALILQAIEAAFQRAANH
ncbi:MAG: pyrroline-5-carboxylate reductase [Legionellaceae bacterium]|nr:pyrroline-5-carboxylate reductase [Legionellaceae bacterium]